MATYYVAAVRDWDEDRMMKAFDHATEVGSEKSFITSDYKTVRNLIKYYLHNHPLYYGYVWAVFQLIGNKEKFVGLEYNSEDSQLVEIATRYMRVRKRLRHNRLPSGYPLSIIA